jgi:O-methyltransferase involved in polyketide biosynthesis
MRPQQASRTARQNALFRAIEARRPASARVADDPLAVRFLTPEFRLLAEAARKLDHSGFEAGAPTLVLWEGVTNYLEPQAVDDTFAFLAAAAGPGSPVLFTYVDRGMLNGTAFFEGAETTLRTVRRVGEPFTFGMNPDEVPGYLADRGFKLEWDTTVSEAARRLYPEGRCPSVPAYYHVVKSMRS